jgi:hypothetical protein
VTPLHLRLTDSVRLVFKPQLLENPSERAASVNGIFCYQRKRRSEDWEDVDSIQLSSLRAGEAYDWSCMRRKFSNCSVA